MISILFIVLVAATTEAGLQGLKIPLLIQHLYTHLTEGRSQSISGFLLEHYSGNRHRDNDQQQDEQLPFKVINNDSFSSYYLPSLALRTAPNSISCNSENPLLKQHFIYQDYLPGIFHPPQPRVVLLY